MKMHLIAACLVVVGCTPAPASSQVAGSTPAATSSAYPPGWVETSGNKAGEVAAQTFSGTGNHQTATFTLQPGHRTFDYTHDGDGAFVVTLKSVDGKIDQQIAWTAGKTATNATFEAEAAQSCYLTIEASGPWSIKVY
jgi:hypothetical protein